jgi:hypothetical protein
LDEENQGKAMNDQQKAMSGQSSGQAEAENKKVGKGDELAPLFPFRVGSGWWASDEDSSDGNEDPEDDHQKGSKLVKLSKKASGSGQAKDTGKKEAEKETGIVQGKVYKVDYSPEKGDGLIEFELEAKGPFFEMEGGKVKVKVEDGELEEIKMDVIGESVKIKATVKGIRHGSPCGMWITGSMRVILAVAFLILTGPVQAMNNVPAGNRTFGEDEINEILSDGPSDIGEGIGGQGGIGNVPERAQICPAGMAGAGQAMAGIGMAGAGQAVTGIGMAGASQAGNGPAGGQIGAGNGVSAQAAMQFFGDFMAHMMQTPPPPYPQNAPLPQTARNVQPQYTPISPCNTPSTSNSAPIQTTNAAPSTSNVPSEMTCFLCGQPGHRRFECPRRQTAGGPVRRNGPANRRTTQSASYNPHRQLATSLGPLSSIINELRDAATATGQLNPMLASVLDGFADILEAISARGSIANGGR